jgi:hypothetical protein
MQVPPLPVRGGGVVIRAGEHITLRNACGLPLVSGVLTCDGVMWGLIVDPVHGWAPGTERTLVRVGCEDVIERHAVNRTARKVAA